jgi:hypothetical protein
MTVFYSINAQYYCEIFQGLLHMHFMCWKVLDYPPYRPVLSPCDFHVFCLLTKALKGCRLELDKDVMAAVVPAAAQEVLFGWNPLADTSMGCLPQCPCLYSFTQNSLQMGFI